MYCKKCGKFIGNDSDLCDECIAKEQGPFPEFSEKQEEVASSFASQTSMFGNQPVYSDDGICLGKSIAAIILSNIGFWILYISIVLMGVGAIPGGVAFLIMGGIPTILGFVFGIQAINNFKATNMIKSGKRIPLLILGISSVVMAGVGLFIASMAVLVALAIA